MLQPVQQKSYQAPISFPTDPSLAFSLPEAALNSGIVLSNATPRFQDRLHNARRVFGVVPLLVFLFSLGLFMSAAQPSLSGFAHAMLQVIAVSLSSSIVCIAAYGFYRYLLDRSSGL